MLLFTFSTQFYVVMMGRPGSKENQTFPVLPHHRLIWLVHEKQATIGETEIQRQSYQLKLRVEVRHGLNRK